MNLKHTYKTKEEWEEHISLEKIKKLKTIIFGKIRFRPGYSGKSKEIFIKKEQLINYLIESGYGTSDEINNKLPEICKSQYVEDRTWLWIEEVFDINNNMIYRATTKTPYYDSCI